MLSSTTTYTYAFGSGNPVGTETTTETVTDAGGAVLRQVTHNYTGSPHDVLLYNGITYNGWQEGLETSTTVAGLETIEYTWAQATPVAWCDSAGSPPYTCRPGNGTGEPANNPRRTRVKTTLAGGLTSQVTFGYDAYDNVTDKYEYDYGAGSPGALVRHTITYYGPNGNYTALPVWLIRLPTQQNIYAGADNLVSLTYYHYDEYLLHETPGINMSGRDFAFGSSYTSRGNLSRKDSWVNTSNTYVSGSLSYDIAGNVREVIDPLGHITSYKYNDGSGAYAFPVEVTNAAGQVTGSAYDVSIGKPIWVTDPNHVVTGYEYDVLDRVTSIRRAAGGGPDLESQTRIYYDNPNWTIECNDQNTTGDCGHQTQTVYDGFGRVTQERTLEDSSFFIVRDTLYDALGRVRTVTSPYRWNYQASSSDGLGYATTTSYDALGRVERVETADGSKTRSEYSGNTITVTDAQDKTKRMTYDALGRLTEVVENPGGWNFVTSYVYDALDNLVQVTQGDQTRRFGYDSLGRLVWATNPETGTISYGYDAAGNLAWRKDNAQRQTNYSYDPLNRLTDKTYSDGTAAVKYSYDDQGITYGVGRLKKVTNGTSTTTVLAYDALGRVLASQQSTGGKTYNLHYRYDLSGALRARCIRRGDRSRRSTTRWAGWRRSPGRWAGSRRIT